MIDESVMSLATREGIIVKKVVREMASVALSAVGCTVNREMRQLRSSAGSIEEEANA